MSSCERLKNLETDLAETEGRLFEALAKLKSELTETQELHTAILKRLLSPEPLYTPVQERLLKQLQRVASSCDCSR